MSEKRFELIQVDEYVFQVKDKLDENKHLVAEDVVDLLNRLNDENEQLRNSIREFLEEGDIFSEKAIEHDIQAYREIKQFDNKDAYYLACAIAKLKKELSDDE